MKIRVMALVLGGLLLNAAEGHAQNKLQLAEDVSLSVGFLLQTHYLHNDSDLVGPRNEDEIRIRRARLRLRGDVTPYVSAVLQTEFANDNLRDPNQTGMSGGDMRVIDAYINLKPMPALQLVVGEHVAAASRQNTTAAGAPMTFDRPLQNNKTLTWGTRSVAAMQTRTLGYTSAGLKGDVDVRDLGATFFGFHKLNDQLSAKHYLGAYQGSDQVTDDSKRFTGRLQLNLFDTEPGYFNRATYFGEKKTVGFGAAFDMQNNAAEEFETGANVDYFWHTLDAFAEVPAGPGSLTVEGAYNNLDLDSADLLANRRGSAEDPLSRTPARQAEGDGFYLQAGYFIPSGGEHTSGWQPWAMYEEWRAKDDAGSYDAFRVGLTYVWRGHNANVKLGYERVSPKAATQPNADTVALGLYLLY